MAVGWNAQLKKVMWVRLNKAMEEYNVENLPVISWGSEMQWFWFGGEDLCYSMIDVLWLARGFRYFPNLTQHIEYWKGLG